MKKNLALLALFAVLTFCLPFAGLLFSQASGNETAAEDSAGGGLLTPLPADAKSQVASVAPMQPERKETEEAPLLILDEGSGKVLTVPMREFVLGAVAAEMPVSYNAEALKAQAVAAHSYALALKAQADSTDASLQGAYFKANPAQKLGFVTDEVMRGMWGAAYDENRARLEAAVDSVLRQGLYYNNAPALACYHAISNGKTESSESVWGTALPYLVSVDSPFDITAPDYTTTLTFTAQEMLESLQFGADGIAPSGEPSAWITGTTQTGAGYVQTVQVAGNSLSGQNFRKALGLRSAAFTVQWDKEAKVFNIVTRGYGHGVGLSQYGANAMALTGKTCVEILAYYYPGTELRTVG